MGGGLSFDGRLATAVRPGTTSPAASLAAGDMSVVAGSIAGHNFVSDVVGPVLGVRSRVLAWARSSARPTRPSIDPEPGDARRLADQRDRRAPCAQGYVVTGRGSLDVNGEMNFAGRLEMAPEVTRELIALARWPVRWSTSTARSRSRSRSPAPGRTCRPPSTSSASQRHRAAPHRLLDVVLAHPSLLG